MRLAPRKQVRYKGNVPTIHDYSLIDVRYPEVARAKLGIADASDLSGPLAEETAARIAADGAERSERIAADASERAERIAADSSLSAIVAAKEDPLTFNAPLSRVADTVSWTGTTSDVPEGTNLYYTAARFNTAFSGKTTTDLAEGTNLYYTQARFDTAFGAKTTTNLTEGANLYYTDARARAAFSATSPMNLSAGGVISISASSATSAGSQSAAQFIQEQNTIALIRGAMYLS